jgi:predicted AlkP superfamily pyrophosphatase or phosphodiesterase
MTPLPRFIWCIFDGLRRDMITPDIAPQLRAFIDAGSDFPSSRCVFPSVTRVNAAAMACGASPGVTGVVANMLFDPNVFSDKLCRPGCMITWYGPSRPTTGALLLRRRWATSLRITD